MRFAFALEFDCVLADEVCLPDVDDVDGGVAARRLRDRGREDRPFVCVDGDNHSRLRTGCGRLRLRWQLGRPLGVDDAGGQDGVVDPGEWHAEVEREQRIAEEMKKPKL